MTNMEKAIKELQDTAIVMAEIQRRQAEVQKLQATRINEVDERAERIEINFDRMTEAQARIDLNLAEITDKLNGLIGYLEGQRGKI